MTAVHILVTALFLGLSCRWLGRPWRQCLLLALVGTGLLIAGFAELASAFTALTPVALEACWILAACASGVGCVFLYRRRVPRPPTEKPPEALAARLLRYALLAAVALQVAAVGIVAWHALPNTYDCMAYHMPRVMYFLQNHSVAHYPTDNERQLFMNPWPAYAQLQLVALAGSDHFVCLLQWTAMVGSLVGVSLIAAALGGNRLTQAVATAIAAAIPMGLLQGATGQTDYLVTLWLVCLAAFVFEQPSDAGGKRWRAFAVGGSLALALLTKGTAYLLAPPFLAIYGWQIVREGRWRAWRPTAVVALLALGLNLPHYVRNGRSFGDPLGPANQKTLLSLESHTPRLLVSNLVRHIAAHLNMDDDYRNSILRNWVILVESGVGVRDGDPRNTYKGQGFQIFPRRCAEDFDPNPGHVVLYLFCFIATMGILPLSWRNWTVGLYAAAVLAGFGLFVWELKWQLYLSRLQLPLFVLAAPWAAMTLARLLTAYGAAPVAAALLWAALPFAFGAWPRPLIGSQSALLDRHRPLLQRLGAAWKSPQLLLGRDSVVYRSREELLFFGHWHIIDACRRVSQEVVRRHLRTLGMMTAGDNKEYGLWSDLRAESPDGALPHIEYVKSELGLDNSLPHPWLQANPDYHPDGIVVIGRSRGWRRPLPDVITVNDRRYQLKAGWYGEFTGLYVQDRRTPPPPAPPRAFPPAPAPASGGRAPLAP